jgi:hypothetical protein
VIIRISTLNNGLEVQNHITQVLYQVKSYKEKEESTLYIQQEYK